MEQVRGIRDVAQAAEPRARAGARALERRQRQDRHGEHPERRDPEQVPVAVQRHTRERPGRDRERHERPRGRPGAPRADQAVVEKLDEAAEEERAEAGAERRVDLLDRQVAEHRERAEHHEAARRQPAQHEEDRVEEHLDGHRPGRCVERVATLEAPRRREGEVEAEVPQVVPAVDEVGPGEAPEPGLRRGHGEQGHEVERVEPREPQRGERRRRDAPLPDRRGVEPEEDEAREQEEEVDGEPALRVQGMEDRVEREPRLDVEAGAGSHVEEVAPVPEHHGQRRDPAQRVERVQALGGRSGGEGREPRGGGDRIVHRTCPRRRCGAGRDYHSPLDRGHATARRASGPDTPSGADRCGALVREQRAPVSPSG